MTITHVPHTVVTDEETIRLSKLGLIPLYVVLTSLVWVLHDHFITLEDEVNYIWKQRRSFSRFMYFWIHYFTIFLVLFDVVQIHSFTIPGVASRSLCIAADPITRMGGAIGLWSVEIVMQMRIYIIYRRNKKIALFNGIIFAISIVFFVWVLVQNAVRRSILIAQIVQLPRTGCPAINGGSQWAQWVPATGFEVILFGFAIAKCFISSSARTKLNERPSLIAILLRENILYFFAVTSVLIFNNLMVVGATKIPWFGFGPFHAALGIATSRLLIHLRKFSLDNLEYNPDHWTNPDMVISHTIHPMLADRITEDEDDRHSWNTEHTVTVNDEDVEGRARAEPEQ
ncbi:hypothetical protein BDN70DRAFT_342950 [Pholiota conissans]|uniref:DUF6533 domain-containing protein n=1 Tax=Pholiota conissans TaxID=109636 RepID=A0A9P5ZAG3_9AGAR|nr:hypothetical protein BDN70DRAFT_342950 [Pholiota conissans]